MLRALLITLLLVTAADAQIALPGSGGSVLPGDLAGGLALPPVPHSLPSLANGMARPLRRLTQARKLHLIELLHEHPRLLETDPDGNLIVRGEVAALSPTDAALARAGAAGFSIIQARSLGALGIRLVILRVPTGTSTWRALRRLRRLDPAGTYDFDSLYTDSGAVTPARMPAVARAIQPAAAARTSRNGVVGLIDGGVDTAQPVFHDAVIHRHGCAGADVPSAHGTAVASLMIGADARFAGAAPGAVLYAADVYCGKPTGGSLDAVTAAFGWMVSEHVPVINVSLVGPPNALLRQVVARVLAASSLIVAAVGNDGPAAPPLYPAAYPGVIGVTAVDGRHRVLFEAERGPQVMFAAPGADIEAARVPRGLATVRGTSFAAPLVAGLLAARLRGPDPRADQLAIRELIAQAVHLGPGGRNTLYGYGLVAAGLPRSSWHVPAATH